jgi:uncharacterized beta barrel domain-containing protein DUF5777
MRKNAAAFAAAGWITLAAARAATAQETPPPEPTPTPAPAEAPDAERKEKEQVVFRPIESNRLVVLPSVEVAPKGTLEFMVTHRFTTPIQDGDINNFFTLDEGNEWGFGLWFTPVKNLQLGVFRSSLQTSMDIYEVGAEYEFPKCAGFAASLRVGEDWRTDVAARNPQSSFFTQAILSYTFGKYVRLTAVPTFLQRTNGGTQTYSATQPGFPNPPLHDSSCRPIGDTGLIQCKGLYDPVWNVPFGASIAITHSITVHGEVYPRFSRYDAAGTGWTVSVEKSLLRHRFAFFAGNQRYVTVDQYTPGIHPNQKASNIYIGFNLYRAWKLM